MPSEKITKFSSEDNILLFVSSENPRLWAWHLLQFLDTLGNSSKFSESMESGGIVSILMAKNIVSNRRNILNIWELKHSPPSVHLALLWKSLNSRNSQERVVWVEEKAHSWFWFCEVF